MTREDFYHHFGYRPTWNDYVKQLAALDERETWAARPAGSLSAKLPPKTIKKNLISNTVSILSREWHRDLP